MRITLLAFGFSLFATLSGIAQTGIISGRVLDSQTSEPLPFANVFINNTTIGTATDMNGSFVLKNVPVGASEIVYSFVGYQSYQTRVAVKENEEIKVNIKLIPLEQQLAEVQVKGTRDKTWERQLKKFEKIFLGNTAFAKECKITNGFVIDFPSTEGEKFTATASAPIDIQNLAMGYRILYFLKSFWSDGIQYSIIGNTKFEDLPAPSDEEAARWMKNRKDAYLGSTRHLFKSLLEDKSIEAGFRLYTDRGNATTARLPSFNQDLEKSVSVISYKVDGLVSAGSSLYEKKISIKNRVEVHYLNKRGGQEVYRDVGHAVSWMEAKNGFALVNNEGIPLNSRDLVISGDMGSSRISNMLPLNYQPQHTIQMRTASQITAERLFETVYLHTNKPFYYPGEIIWFKGYMNYRIRGLADSLSAILYVDLINAERKVIASKVLRIDSGAVAGNLRLPSEITNGTYALVAYTNWMKNYGDQSYFKKVLPVLNIYDKPISASNTTVKNSPEIEVTLDKEKYHLRELVNVSVSLLDESDKAIPSSLSVAVTDVTQVPAVAWSKSDIRKDLAIPAELKVSSDPFTYNIEYGVTWNGEFQSGLKKPEPTKLTIVRENFEDVRKETTAADGKFSLLNLNIKDSALYSFQALRGDATYGKVVALPRSRPSISFNAADYTIGVEHKTTVQRVLSAYELPPDATLLTEVEVKSTKLEDPKVKTENAYGKAEAVISNDEISKYGSIEQLIRAKIMGFVLSFNGVHWTLYSNRLQPNRPERVIVGGNGSRQTDVPPQVEYPSTEPFLAIDNRQILINSGETVGDRLMSLDPSSIDRIEVSSTATAYTGANGGYGLVAVFLKKGAAPDNNKFQKLYIRGYDTSVDFKGPDYANKAEDHSQSDFRSTLYWKKNLKINSSGHAEFSFYTSDLPGQYRIVIEGVTEKGLPVHYEQFMNVEAE